MEIQDNKFGLHGKLQAKDGMGNELTNILLQASKLVSSAEGCLLYLISHDDTTPDSVWVTEVWNSQQDHENSLKIEEVRQLIGRAIPLLAENQIKGQRLSILGGHGLN
jgi:quinol monooxygenase YgiN